MNPYVEKKFRDIYQSNPDIFAQKDYQKIQDIFNSKGGHNIPDLKIVPNLVNSISFEQPFEGIEDEESKKKKTKQTERAKFVDAILQGDTDSLFPSEEEIYSSDSLLTDNKEYVDNLLDYVGRLESDNRPNAYFGDYTSDQKHDFTNMPLKAVMDWQKNNKDVAVGRFQFKRRTLEDVIKKEGIDTSKPFTDDLQRQLAISLLKRRGLEDFLRDPAKNRDKFSLGLAKEFASIPLTYDIGEKRKGDSYYAGSTSNKARSSVDELSNMLDVETWRGNISKNKDIDKRHQEKLEYFQRDTEFGEVNASFIENNLSAFDSDEKNIQIALTKRYGDLGFKFEQAVSGSDNIVITAPNGKVSEPISVGVNVVDVIGDSTFGLKKNVKNAIVANSPLASAMLGLKEFNTADKGTNKEDKHIATANSIKKFMADNYSDPAKFYINSFDQNPYQTVNKINQDIVRVSEKQLEDATLDLNMLESQIERLSKFDYETGAGGYTIKKRSKDYDRYLELEEQIEQKKSTINTREGQQERLSRTVSRLIDASGGLDRWVSDDKYGEPFLSDLLNSGMLRPEHMILPSVRVQGRNVSYEYLKSVVDDFTMRNAYHNGDVDIQVDMNTDMFSSELVKGIVDKMSNDSIELLNKQTHDGSLKERIDYGVKSLGIPLLASSLDVVTNVAETIYDVANLPDRLMTYYSLPDDMDEKKKQDKVESMFNAHFNPLFKSMRAEVRKLRDEQINTSGSISDFSSAYELFTKGGVAAAESLPITTLFVLAPEVGLSVAGLSVYGGSMNQYMEYMNLASDYKKANGYVPLSLRGYENMTVDRARSLSLAKGVGEVAITRLFTYNMLKGMMKASKGAGYASKRELLDLVREYGKGLRAKGTGVLKTAGYEIPEEGLIAIENMFVDDVSGVQNYEFSDYVEEVKNTSVASLFTSVPLGVLGANKRSAAANDYVMSRVSDRIMSKEEQNLSNEFKNVDSAIMELEKNGKTPSQALVDKRLELSQAVVQNKLDKMVQVAISDDAVVREIASSELKIEMLSNDYNNSTNDTEKDLFKKKLTEEVKKIENNSKLINPDSFLQRSKETTEILESQYLTSVDKTEEEEEGVQQPTLEPVTEFDSSMRQGATNLGLMRDANNSGTLFDRSQNIFTRHGDKIDEMISFLNQNNDSSMNEDQKKEVQRFLGKLLTDENGNFKADNSGFLKTYERVVEANKEADKLNAAMPSNMAGKKIKPQSFIESLFTIKNVAISSVEQVLSNMFKNSSMRMIPMTISNNIDVAVTSAQRFVDGKRSPYQTLSFLGDKISKSRNEKFQSLESQIERGMLAFLGKYVDQGKQGRSLQETIDKQFQTKVIELQRYITEKLSRDNSTRGKQIFDAYSKVYQKMVEGSINYGNLESRADADNVAGINYIREMFEEQKGTFLNHMRDYVGNEPTMWNRFAPTFFANVNSATSAATAFTSDFDYMREPGSPSILRESGEQMSIPGDLYLENYDRLAFKVFENTLAHVGAAPLMSRYEGLINSKKFEDLFDQTASKRAFSKSDKNDFEYMKELLLQKTDRLNKRLNNVGSQTQVQRSFANVARDIFGTITKVAATKRLATVDMRVKQAYSALFAQIPNMGPQARTFLISKTLNFTMFKGTEDVNNKLYENVLSKSVTMSRGGKSAFTFGYLDKANVEKARTVAGKVSQGIGSGINKGADYLLESLLANSDQLAGRMTFLSFYMDYEMKNNKDVQNMNDKEFWDYTQEKVNPRAIAYADEQVSRSQTQSTPWNLGGVFGADSSEGGKMMAQVLFLFGRFAYNRKVGIANDLSIQGDEYASDQDKSDARRRIVSAGIEIGVFKALTPTFSLVFSELMSGMISSLLGYDDELDVVAGKYANFYGKFTGETVSRQQMKLYNYDRNLSKEFFTSMVDGMMPSPTPSFFNDVMYSVVNNRLKDLGITKDDLFNIYNPSMRSLGSELGPISEYDIAGMILSNAGILELATEDVRSLVNGLAYFKSGEVPSYMGIGKNRMVVDQAKKAADVLHTTEFLNLLFPSADLARFNRILRGKIEREYLTTSKKDVQAIQDIPEKKKGGLTKDAIRDRLNMDKKIN